MYISELKILNDVSTLLQLKKYQLRSTWVAQLGESPTVDFGSGHNPRVVGLSPAKCGACLRFSLSSSSAPLPFLCPLSLSNKKIKIKIK